MIYAIDFDGTIVENAFPEIGKLKPIADYFIRALKERGDKWILYTMREGEHLERAMEYLREINLVPDAVNDNLPEIKEFYGNNPRKVFANIYYGLRKQFGHRQPASGRWIYHRRKHPPTEG